MKVLLVSYFFIPSTSANAKRPFYIARGFLDAGWEVDIVSSDGLVPPEFEELIFHENLTIKRIKDPYNILDRKLNGCVGQGILSCLRGVLWPDVYVLWTLQVARQIEPSQYDRVFISIIPISMMLFSVFKDVSEQWVFDYSESFSPKRAVARRSPIPYLMKPFLNLLQRKVLNKSGAALFTSNETLKDYLKSNLLPEEKAVLVPLFYNSSVYKGGVSPRDHLIIEYTGVFGMGKEKRSPDVFFHALSLFLERNPPARENVRFIFHGRWRERHTALITKYNLEDFVKINPAIPHEYYLEVLEASSVLLLITDEADNMFIPSKMLDYFGAKKPILAFVPSNSETYSILKDAGMTEFTSEATDVEHGASCLENIWYKWNAGRLSCENATTDNWSFAFQMPRILHVLDGQVK